MQLHLVNDQISYHRRQGPRREWRNCLTAGAGQLLFLFTFYCVFVEVAADLMQGGPMPLLGVLTIAFPGFAAAFFAIRAQSEFEVLARRSKTLVASLGRTTGAIEDICPGGPLASQELASEINDAAALMLAETEGWAEIFRTKAVELP